MQKQYYFFIGTTAEYIKLAPVISNFKHKKVPFKIISSGQTEIDFKMLQKYTGKVSADIKFLPKTPQSSVLYFAGWAIRTLIFGLYALRKEYKKNDTKQIVLVHGDTVSSLLGALIAKIYRLRLVHIESGLRSFKVLEPFPEELCRYAISSIADIHFCPNKWSVNNLKNKKGLKINTNQNTLIETYNWVIKDIDKKNRKVKGKYFVLVFHRQEHVIFGKAKGRKILQEILKNINTDMKCVFMVHDISRDFVDSIGINTKDVIFQKRMKYKDFMELIYHSEFMITDGGSNQEELYYMGKPCLVLRNVTERIEGIGKNVVISKNSVKKISNFIRNYKTYRRNKVEINLKNKPSKIVYNFLNSLK